MLTKFSWLNWVRTFSTQPARGRRAKAKTHQVVMVEPLEPRAMLAATTFDSGTLTIDFSAADETVTLSNNGTNITVTSTETVTGAGSTFTTGSVTRVVVTDSGDFGNQLFTISGSADYSLSNGLDVTGAERFQLSRAVATDTAGASVVVSEQMDLFAALTATDGNIFLSANQQTQATSGSFFGIDVFGGSVTTSGTGTVTLLGRGGDTGITQIGVRVDGGGFVSGASTMITGTGGASSGVANWGVYVSGFPDNSTISSTGGNVTVNGTGGGVSGSSQNIGVRVVNGGTITADGTGAVNIIAAGGVGSSSHGVEIAASPTADIGKITTNSGALSINATAANSSSIAINLGANGRLATGLNRDLSITTDSLAIASGGIIDAGLGTVTLANKTSGRTISLGSASVASIRLGLTSSEINRISASRLIMGSSTAGDFTVSASISPNSVAQLELVTGGQIIDGSTTGTDISVAKLGLTAGSGIGVGNGLETTVSFLEGTTATGGIFVNNSGGLTIGAVNSTLDGLRVTGSSGGIDLQNTGGDVRVTVSGDFVIAPGNVSIKTLTSGNIVTANNNGFSFGSYTGSVNSTAGTLTLDAAGDIDLGETASGNVNGDLQSSGNLLVKAGGSITIDDQASVQTLNGGSTVTLIAGSNISVLHTHAPGSLFGSQNQSAGLISVTTGAGGTFTLDGGVGTPGVNGNPGIIGGAGGLRIAADDMSLPDDIWIFTGANVTLTTVTAGRAIDLGSDASGTLGLTATEINNITIAGSLTIGDSTSGSITVSAPITTFPSTGPSTISLVTGASVLSTNSSGSDITVANLNITAPTGIGASGTPLTFSATTLTTNSQGSNGSQFLSEADLVSIGSGDLLAGAGTITVTAGTFLTASGGDVTGNVVVLSGATLGGSGSITGNVSGGGTVAPGNSPGVLTINGDFTPTGTVAFEVNPPAATAGTDYDQIVVNGAVDLSGATLTLAGTAGAVPVNQLATLILNDGTTDAISPSSSFADGDVVTINGNSYRIFYGGGDGNDLVLVENSTPTVVYVDDSFSANSGQVIADADLGATGSQSAIFGVTAFTTISAALAAVSASGTVIVNSGTYAETVSATGTQTLQIGGADAAQTVTINSLATVSGTTVTLAGTSALTIGDATDTTIAGLISGGGSLTKQGASIVTVTGDNTYTGATSVSAGTLRVTANNGLGTTAAGTSVASGATLDLRNVSYTTTEAVSLGGGTLANSSGTTTFAGTVTMTADSNFTTSSSVLVLAGAVLGSFRVNKTGAGTLRLSNTGNTFARANIGGGTLQLGAAGVIPDTADLTNSSAFDVNGFDEALDSMAGAGSVTNSQSTLVTLTLGAGNNDTSSTQVGGINGAINIRKIGSGRQVLSSGVSTFTGTVTIDAGTLAVSTEGGGGGIQGLGSASAGTIVNAGGTLEIRSLAYGLAEPVTVNGGTILATGGTSSFTGAITLSTAMASIAVNPGASLTLSGVIDGSQGFEKTSGGTLILSGDNTYTGDTTISGGTLLVNGSLAAGGTVRVNGGTLGGNGTINSAVMVATGGNLSPGNSPDILDTGSIAFASGSTFIAEVNGATPGTEHDQLNVTGSVTLGGATLMLSGTITTNVGQQIVLINNDDDGDTVSGTFANLPEGTVLALNGLPFQITYAGGTGGNDVVLTEIANYNIFLDNDGNLVFTDLLGNINDNVTLSYTGTRYTITNSAQLLFTQIVGATGNGTNTVSVAADDIVAAIFLNGAGGGDTLTISYPGDFFFDKEILLNGGLGSDTLQTTGSGTSSSVTINGDEGDDTVNLNASIDFDTDFNLDVDLLNDTAMPGTDSITVGGSAAMTFSGAGTATFKASSTISFAAASSVATDTGELLVETTTLSVDGGLSSSTGGITLVADSITISTNGLVDGQSGIVSIEPHTFGTTIDLGGADDVGILGLSAAELNRITAATLSIGGNFADSITVSADITRSAGTNIELIAAGSIVQNSDAGSIDTAGGTLKLFPVAGSYQPNRAGTDVAASTLSVPGGQIRINIDGTTVDTEYTQLNVSGAVDLASTSLLLTGGFMSAFGNTFTIVLATSITGQFSNFEDGSTFDFNGRTLRIDYTNTTVTLTDATPQAPTLATAGNISYIENDAATPIAAAVLVDDLDNGTLASATITITNFVSGEDVLAFVNDGSTMGNIAVESNAAGVLTLTSAGASATLAEWQAALQAVTYFNSSDNPDTTTRLVDFVVSDGSLSSTALTSMVNITAVNDAPMLTAPGNITYTENDPATAVAAGIVVDDFDSTTLASATISINNFLAGEDMLGFVANSSTMGNIQLVSNDNRTIVLTSAGATATLAEWQAALRAVTYFNASENPTDNEAVLVEFIVNDGTDDSNLLTSMITLAPVNDAPTLTTGAEITYTENDAATVVAAGIMVDDVDNMTLASAAVTITNFVSGEDVLALTATTGIGNIVVSGNAGGVLTLTSAGATATRLQWQAALRSVAYFNSSDNPNTTTRNVSFVINDGDLDSETLTSMVNVTAVNDAPMLTTPGNITFTENAAATVVAAGIMVDDVDNMTLASATVTITNFVSGEDVLAYAVTAGTGNIMVAMAGNGVVRLTSAGATATLMQWQTALRAITYQNSSENPALTQRTVTFVVNDGDLDSNTLTSTIDIAAVNDAPVLTVAGTVNHTENGPATVIAPAITVNDVDNATFNNATITITNFVAGQDMLAFANDGSTMGNIAVASNANAVLTLTSAGGSATVAQWQAALRSVTYANTSEAPTTTPRNVTFVVRDKDANSNTLTSTVSITAVNDAPVLAVPGTVTFTEGLPAVAIAAGLTVTDLDSTLTTATVTITNFVAGQDVLAFTNDGSTMGNIAVTVNVGESLTLTSAGGSATLAQWQAALRAVTYANTSQVPDATVRTVTFVVSDGTDLSNGLSNSVSVVDTGLPQEWVINGLRARLGQSGDDLVLTNEFGMVSRGRVVSPTQIVALDWGNLVGNLTNNGQRIEWANGTVWDVPVPPAANTMLDVSGGWKINGLLAQILQKGRELTLINEFGQTVAARLSDDNQTIIATGWGITGNIVGDQILWSNQTQWSRASFPIPTLSQNWLIGNNQHTEINVQPNPAELLLKNEFGALSRAVFTSSTQIFATDWKLTGTLTAGNTIVNWANGTQWTADTSAMDSLFASDFDPFN